VPPVNQAISNQPLLVIVLPKPTHAPSTTSILDPSTEQAAALTKEPSTEPTDEYPAIFQVHGICSHRLATIYSQTIIISSIYCRSIIIIISPLYCHIIIISPLYYFSFRFTVCCT